MPPGDSELYIFRNSFFKPSSPQFSWIHFVTDKQRTASNESFPKSSSKTLQCLKVTFFNAGNAFASETSSGVTAVTVFSSSSAERAFESLSPPFVSFSFFFACGYRSTHPSPPRRILCHSAAASNRTTDTDLDRGRGGSGVFFSPVVPRMK